MKRRTSAAVDTPADPFRERGATTLRWRTRVLGAQITFESNSAELLALAREAFDRVPAHRWARGDTALTVTLMLARDAPGARWAYPPEPLLGSGGGLLTSHVDAANFAVISPGRSHALVQVTPRMLRHRRLLRYEFIEFAALTLAARVQRLVPLHAGCVGARGRGVLLLGGSGAGKSTLALHAALAGLEFLAEDSLFLQPGSLAATGLPAFVHARAGSLGLVAAGPERRSLARAPRIRRRSGAAKLEIDLRRGAARLAARPLRIVATLVLSAAKARGGPRLSPLPAARLRRILRAGQAYAVQQPGWREFERRLVRAGGYLLSRAPPAAGVTALRNLLANAP